METGGYEKVENGDTSDSGSLKYFFRQVIVCSSLWVIFFLLGVCMGAPTVYVPQIRREANSTEVITDSMAAMLMAVYGYSALPWVIILPLAATVFGRKKPCIFVFSVVVIAEIVFFTSTTYTQLLISQALEGIMGATVVTISSMIFTEYASPKYRGFFLTFKSATCLWGIWVSNALGTFFHWKVISMLKIVLSIYPLVTVFFWPESPLWLASKDRRVESIKTHRWLKGRSIESEQELRRLFSSQNTPQETSISLKLFTQKHFYKPTLLCICLMGMYHFTGKLAVVYYSIDILKMMTSDETTAYYGMLILDGVTVFGMYLGTILSRFLRRRTLFFSSSYLGITALYGLALYVYLVSVSAFPANKYAAITLLSVYSLGMGCGPLILCSSFYAEILPLKCRSFAVIIVGLSDRLIFSFVSHITPTVIKLFGLHSTFLIFGVSSTVFIVILYFYLPETKDKSLHEIEDAIVGRKKILITDVNPDLGNDIQEKTFIFGKKS